MKKWISCRRDGFLALAGRYSERDLKSEVAFLREIGGFVSERERDLKLLVCVCVIASCTLFENVFMC